MKALKFTTEVDTTVEADVEISLDGLIEEMDDEQRAYLLEKLQEATPEVAKLAEQVFYHYTGAPTPECLRLLIFTLIGRTM